MTLMEANSKLFKCYPADEAIAFIYYALQWVLPDKDLIHKPAKDAQSTISKRSVFWQSLKSYDTETIAVCDRIQKTFQQLENRSPEAIDSISLNSVVLEALDLVLSLPYAIGE